MVKQTDMQSHSRLIVHGMPGLAERVQALDVPDCVVVTAAAKADVHAALLEAEGPAVVLAGRAAGGIADLRPDRSHPTDRVPVLVMLTTDHALAAAAEGLWMGDGLCLLRDDAEDAALRTVLVRALNEAQANATASVPSRADDALQLEDDWANVIAHDLRTPLGINNGYAALLLESPEIKASKRREILQRIAENGAWMLQLVDGLLDVESLRHRGGRLAPQPTALGELLEGVAHRMERLAEFQGVRIACDPVSTLERFGLDRTRVEQVLHNLVTNALKFSPSGGEVRMSAEADGLQLRFRVSDQGVGMTPEEAGAAFAKFTPGARGRGLGLSIARAIVELHGGRIWVETAPDAGSRFHFTITATERVGPCADPCDGTASDLPTSI